MVPVSENYALQEEPFTCLLLVCYCFCNAGLLACIRHSLDECVRTFGSRRPAREDVTKFHVLAVNSASGVVILLHDRTFECQAGERTLRARVRQYLGVHFPVSSGRRVTANRARSS